MDQLWFFLDLKVFVQEKSTHKILISFQSSHKWWKLSFWIYDEGGDPTLMEEEVSNVNVTPEAGPVEILVSSKQVLLFRKFFVFIFFDKDCLFRDCCHIFSIDLFWFSIYSHCFFILSYSFIVDFFTIFLKIIWVVSQSSIIFTLYFLEWLHITLCFR